MSGIKKNKEGATVALKAGHTTIYLRTRKPMNISGVGKIGAGGVFKVSKNMAEELLEQPTFRPAVKAEIEQKLLDESGSDGLSKSVLQAETKDAKNDPKDYVTKATLPPWAKDEWKVSVTAKKPSKANEAPEPTGEINEEE